MGEQIESKKLALLRMLEIFEKYSDQDHPLKQEDIIRILERDYGISLERKAVSANISLLKEALIYDNKPSLESDRRGTYLESRTFTNAELRLLIDSVLSSKHISENYSKDLIKKICNLSNNYFLSHIRHVHSVSQWSKTENKSLFLNVEFVDEAIETNKQLKFDYNKYGKDKKLHKTASHSVSPYQMVLHNQRYYLVAYNEHMKNMVHYRLDHITNVSISEKTRTPLNKIDGYKNGLDFSLYSTVLPYMFTDKPVEVRFLVDEIVLDQVIDWLGPKIRIEEQGNGKLLVITTSSLKAFEYWAMQYLNYVEVVSPIELREKIKENIKNAQEKYK